MPRRRTRPGRAIAVRLYRHAENAISHVQRVELIAHAGLAADDVARVYAGAYLTFHARFEGALERLFVGLLAGEYESERAEVRPLIDVRSSDHALRIVEAGRPYADWLPFRYVEERAKLFFRRGQPFANISVADRNTLNTAVVLRNLIAHNSRHAHERFRKHIIGTRPLPPSQRTGPGYLRGTHSGTQTRFEFLVGELVTLMYRLCA